MIRLAKSFVVKPPSKDQDNWLIAFNWPDQYEGQVVLGDTLKQTLVNVQKEASSNLINWR